MPRPAATFPPSSFLARNATGLLKSRPTAADIAAQTPQKVQLLLTKGCDLHPSLQDPAVALRIKSGIVALANSESGPDRIVSQKCKAKSGRFFRAYVATADIQEGGSVLSLLAGTAVHASELESAPLLRGAIDQRSRNVDVCGVCLGATQLQETAGHPEHVVLLHDPNIRISSNDVRKNPMKNNDRGSDPNVAVVPFRTNAAAHGAVPMWTYGAAVVSLPGGMKKDARIAVDLGDARWDEMRRMRAMVAMARSDVTANTQELLCEVVFPFVPAEEARLVERPGGLGPGIASQIVHAVAAVLEVRTDDLQWKFFDENNCSHLGVLLRSQRDAAAVHYALSNMVIDGFRVVVTTRAGLRDAQNAMRLRQTAERTIAQMQKGIYLREGPHKRGVSETWAAEDGQIVSPDRTAPSKKSRSNQEPPSCNKSCSHSGPGDSFPVESESSHS